MKQTNLKTHRETSNINPILFTTVLHTIAITVEPITHTIITTTTNTTMIIVMLTVMLPL